MTCTQQTLKLDTERDTMLKSRVRMSGIFKNMKGSDGAVNVSDSVDTFKRKQFLQKTINLLLLGTCL